MKKLLEALFLGMLLLGGCGAAMQHAYSAATPPPPADDFFIEPGGEFAYTCSSNNLSSTAIIQGLQHWAEELKKVTKGKFVLTVYPDGQLYTNEGEMPALQAGEIEMVTTTPGNAMGLSPWFGMLDMPYNFKNYDHMVRFYTSEHGKAAFARIQREQNLRLLSFQLYGIRNTWLRDIGRVPKNPQEFKGVSIRCAGTPIMMAIGFGLGGNPTPITISESFSALMTGTVDAMEFPTMAGLSASLYESCKYFLPTAHMYNVMFPVISEDAYQRLAPEFQKYLTESCDKWMRWADRVTIEGEADAREKLVKNGMTIVDDIDLPAFMKNCTDYLFNKSDIAKDWDMELYNQIQKLGE